MKKRLSNCFLAYEKAIVFALAIITLASHGNTAMAATTQLADIPLANAASVSILPNIYFIIDTSGSMAWDFMPGDSASDRPSGSNFQCSAINKIYYDPTVTYSPPKDYLGNDKSWGSNYSRVPLNGYKTTDGTIDLTSSDNARYYNWATVTTTSTDTVTTWCRYSNLTSCQDYSDRRHTYRKTETITTTSTDTGCLEKVEIVSSRNSYPGPNGTTRTYDQEIANFANWQAWYSRRMSMMKTALSLAFSNVRGEPDSSDLTDQNYFHARVGFSGHAESGVDDGNLFLKVDNFQGTHKQKFFTRLFAINPTGGTPLRSALNKAGQIYSGAYSDVDPVQYSCQRNFTILSTDGYWNLDSTFSLADQDGISSSLSPASSATARGNWVGWLGRKTNESGTALNVLAPSLDRNRAKNTLADVAYFYYHKILRKSGDGTCSSPLTGKNLCPTTGNVPKAGTLEDVDDVATYQHMTTFTIGLGVSGTLTYEEGYKTSSTGDYKLIKDGTKSWPVPAGDSPTAIDDLWHAAVNGRGTYFSARNPDSLIKGLNTALGTMQGASGSGAAAATSNLQPIEGDNFIYIANYRTVQWDGELSAYTIDLSTGDVSSAASWQASSKLQDKIVADTSGLAGNKDTRTIYTWSGTGASKMKSFLWDSLNDTEKQYFNTNQLSQYSSWSSSDQAAATGTSLVNYLRGQDRYEDQERTSSFGTYYRLYRDRDKALGDIVHSQPVYIKTPFYDYLDTGYAAYKTNQESRLPTIYVAANDGMLHAFNGNDGTERWAYVPPMVLNKIYLLADKNYTTNHRFFLDGPIAISDVNDNGTWKTLLVGALGKGGRGLYALDVTNPSTPKALWNYTADDNPNLGYTYGTPIITKLDPSKMSADDKNKLSDVTNPWVVIVASGYNNVPENGSYTTADGKGHIFVLDAATGTLIKDIGTDVGSSSNPAGLAYLNIKVADFQKDNTALAAYGGDLYGNLWRFDLNTGTAGKVIALGSNKPITVPPEIGEMSGKTVLFFGTGRYLGSDDLNNTDTQSFYAVKDDGSTTVTPSEQMVKQTMANTSERTVTGTALVDWNTKYGWYLDLPASKERVNLGAQLYFGTVIFTSTIPDATECQPGGTGALYELDAANGMRVSGATSNVILFDSPIVGMTVARLPGGTAKIYAIPASGSPPRTPPTLSISQNSSSGGKSGWRVMWRELGN